MPIIRTIVVRSFSCLALILSVVAITPARAEVAPDVVVFCEPTLQHALTDVGTLWRKQSGIPVRIFTSPTWALLEQVSHGARSDLVIGEGDASAAAAMDRHLIKPETLQRLWRNQLVVAVTAEASKTNPGLSSSTRNLSALAGKAPIAIVDPSIALAGAEGKRALLALGLWDAVGSKSIGVVDTADASYLLAEGKVQLAVIYATDVAANPAFAVADRFPATSYGPIVYWVAQTRHVMSPNADKFAAFLRQAQAQERLKADGLEMLP